MNNEKVTILMSLYNTPANQLKESIESILMQSYKNFEFLIINDGSNEETLSVLKKYNDDRIKVYNNETNLGLEKSLNKGLNLANTKYIIRMDTDDIAYNNRIEKQMDFVKKHPEYSIVCGRADLFDENGIYGTTSKVGEIRKDDLLFGTPFIHPTMIIKKEDIIKCGGYPEYKRCEDYAMVMNLYANGYKGFIMDDILIKYRMDNNGYLKKKFKFRKDEAKIKLLYFKKMKIKWYKYIYIIKPFIAGLIPKKILRKYHKSKLIRSKI